VQYLFSDCCRDRLALTVPGDPCDLLKTPRPALQKQNVLFLCTGNSARSIFAEALLRDKPGETFNAFSAGTSPAGAPHPMALEVLSARGHDVRGLTSKDLSLFRRPDAPDMQIVVTLCDRAAHEECPAWSGHPLNTHWSLPDPAQIEGPLEIRRRGFEQVYDLLERKIDALSTINLQSGSRRELQKALDDIGGRALEGIVQ
jgi:protein-tyrosine-phosphatase